MDVRAELRREVADTMVRMGQQEEFAALVADQLRTEISLRRMLGYLRQAKPKDPAEIADEMLAIQDDRDRWIGKKKAEYYNQKLNELMEAGLEDPEES